jgi:hypothetical protein
VLSIRAAVRERLQFLRTGHPVGPDLAPERSVPEPPFRRAWVSAVSVVAPWGTAVVLAAVCHWTPQQITELEVAMLATMAGSVRVSSTATAGATSAARPAEEGQRDA